MSPELYRVVTETRLAVTMMRAAARTEATMGGDYARRQAAALREQAQRLEDAVADAQREIGA